jgi:hypothetical protein
MIWGVPELVSFFSTFYTLQPGVVIETGTPGGTAWATDPELGGGPYEREDVARGGYLRPGDVVTVDIDEIGALMNPVVAARRHAALRHAPHGPLLDRPLLERHRRSVPGDHEFRGVRRRLPTNISVGGRRLGLRTALLTGIGDDPVGDFVLRFLGENGVIEESSGFYVGRELTIPERWPSGCQRSMSSSARGLCA